MRTLKLTLAYDGTRYVGWQRQAAGQSIQGLLEDVLRRFDGRQVTVHGAGRTDAGVHALGQVASFQFAPVHACDTLIRALNAELPDDIRILDANDVADDFHARFNARAKRYRYQIRNSAIANPFHRAFEWHVPESLDVKAMEQAAQALVGTHDFAAFQSTGTDMSTTVRTMTQAHVVTDDGLLLFDITGDGFLRHMVRAIVGTLVEVGRGARTAASMAHLLAGSTRADAGPTAPPHGLFLVSVHYD